MRQFSYEYPKNISVAFEAAVPPGIQDGEALLHRYYHLMRFPFYYGANWNAFDECMCDLEWLPPGNVVLVHRDLPLSEDKEQLSYYLSTLYRLTDTDLADDERRVFVVFPPSARDTIESIIEQVKKEGFYL